MKKLLFLPLFALMALILPSCSDDDNNPGGGGETIETTTTYNGKLIVNGSYAKDSVDCKVEFAEDKQSFTLDIYKVKFAEAMPVSIDIAIPGIPATANGNDVTFSGDTIVPLVGVVPSPAFTFYNIDGEIKDGELKFSAVCTRGLFTFRGKEVIE